MKDEKERERERGREGGIREGEQREREREREGVKEFKNTCEIAKQKNICIGITTGTTTEKNLRS